MDEILDMSADELLRLEAEDGLRRGRDVEPPPVWSQACDEVGGVLGEEPETRLAPADLVLHPFAVGDVADERAHDKAAVRVRHRHAHLGRKDTSVAPTCLDLDALADRRALSRREELAEPFVMSRRDEVLRQRLPDRFVAGPTEHLRGALVPLGDQAGLVERQDRVERRVNHAAEARLRIGERVLRRAAREEPADLIADGLEDRVELGVDLRTELASEELDDGEDAVAVPDREAEAGMQPGDLRRRGPAHGGVGAHVGDPDGPLALPDSTGEPLAAAVLFGGGDRDPLLEPGAGRLPGLAELDDVPLRVDAPERGVVPAEALAEGAQDLLAHLPVARGAGDDSRHRVDRREAALGTRALGHVDRETDHAVNVTLRVPKGRIVHVERGAGERDLRVDVLAFEGPLDAPHDLGDVRVHLERGASDGPAGGEPEPAQPAAFAQEDARVLIEDEEDHRRARDRGMEAGLGLALERLRDAFVGDVHEARDDQRGLAVGSHDRHRLAEEPDLAAVRADEPREISADRPFFAERPHGDQVFARDRRPVLAEARDPAEELAADDLIPRRPEHPERRVVRVHQGPGAVADDDPAADRVIDLPDEAFSADREPRVGPDPRPHDANARGAQPRGHRAGGEDALAGSGLLPLCDRRGATGDRPRTARRPAASHPGRARRRARPPRSRRPCRGR